jgi:2'-hydroxyisoflavone reductase
MRAMSTTRRLLVIGGGRFVGRHLVQVAQAAGWQVTVFNRGQSGPAPEGVTVLTGDRRGSLAALSSGTWDAVIDTCGYLPGEVAAMAQHLRGRVGRYVFISSVSAYAGFSLPNTEHSPLARTDQPDTQVVDGNSYGPLKALCEAEVTRVWGDAAVLVRPGLIVGPHDPTGRFTWWPARVARAVDAQWVLAPGHPDAPLQFIDARDLAAFVLQALDRDLHGPVNVVAPAGQWTWGELLRVCADVAACRPRWAWVPDDVLLAQGVAPWSDLPLWLPAQGDNAAFMQVDSSLAQAAGLTIRPLVQTVADTLAWWCALPADRKVFSQTGLSAEREAALLQSRAR